MRLTLLENFRSMFYAPFYANTVLGSYEAEGLDVEVRMTPQLGKTLDAVVAGEAEMSWGGPMRLLYALDANPKSGAVAFCEIVGREPTLLVGRTPNAGFRMGDLAGKTVAIFTEAPTPWICLQHDLRLAGVDPASIRRSPAGTMEENAALLRAGKVEAIQVFEPMAQQLIDEGAGHLWYAAADRGPTSFTTLFTTRQYIERNPEAVLRMTRAMYRTLKWIHAHDGRELAQVVADYLPEIPQATLAACCNAYKALGLWSLSPVVDPAGFEWKRDAMFHGGEIHTRLAYEACIDPSFAAQAVRDDPPSI
ncbi:MAG: ABC transporter substrate-binding protein [bacterium]|jgi:NitT/TauT family transport system substrate-binding protein|nr:ABC transporter substrate-binding protein [Betaproteobacteria bacterium]